MSDTLAIRKFPQELKRVLKIRAAQAGIPLRQYIVDLLEASTKPKGWK
jgi:plasmid stability protein